GTVGAAREFRTIIKQARVITARSWHGIDRRLQATALTGLDRDARGREQAVRLRDAWEKRARFSALAAPEQHVDARGVVFLAQRGPEIRLRRPTPSRRQRVFAPRLSGQVDRVRALAARTQSL